MSSSNSNSTNSRPRCPVCSVQCCHKHAVNRHMQQKHPTEWANQHQGRLVGYYPCDVPGCTMLANNTRNDYYVDHLSAQHGIDIPSMRRTTDAWYLKRKTNNTLRSHIVQEAAELNELNTKISQLEGCLAVEPPAVPYQSRHGFDVTTIFETDQAQLPSKKSDLVTYLRDMRAERNKAGALYTRPGVTDTREAVLDDLETLLDELLDEE